MKPTDIELHKNLSKKLASSLHGSLMRFLDENEKEVLKEPTCVSVGVETFIGAYFQILYRNKTNEKFEELVKIDLKLILDVLIETRIEMGEK